MNQIPEVACAKELPRVARAREREVFIEKLPVRIHLLIVMIRWTGLAPWEFEFTFPGSLISTFLDSGATSPYKSDDRQKEEQVGREEKKR